MQKIPPPIDRLPLRPPPTKKRDILKKPPPPPLPPRPPCTRKVKDGQTKKSDYFIYGFAVGMVVGQLANMAIQEFLQL